RGARPCLVAGRARHIRRVLGRTGIVCCPRTARGRLCSHTTVPARGRSSRRYPFMTALTRPPCPKHLQAGSSRLLPRILLHAQVSFRHLKCPHKKEDAIAETVALAWAWYVRLARKGKDAARFASALASYAARAAKSGRRLCGQKG